MVILILIHGQCTNGWFEIKARTQYEAVLHYTLDISKYDSYSWFQWCWYFDKGKIPSNYENVWDCNITLYRHSPLIYYFRTLPSLQYCL